MKNFDFLKIISKLRKELNDTEDFVSVSGIRRTEEVCITNANFYLNVYISRVHNGPYEIDFYFHTEECYNNRRRGNILSEYNLNSIVKMIVDEYFDFCSQQYVTSIDKI